MYTYTIKNKPLREQNRILQELLGVNVELFGKLPVAQPDTDGIFLVPQWQKIAKTYPEALQKALDAIKSTRPFHNWREGQIDDKHIRRLNPDMVVPEIFSAQLGKKWAGKSVRKARNYIAGRTDEFTLGAYEVAIILLTHPERLQSYDDLWIDCPADEWSWYADGGFSESPCLRFGDDEVWFGTNDVDYALEFFGTGSGFPPQSNLESGALDPISPSTLESALKIVREAGYKIFKEI